MAWSFFRHEHRSASTLAALKQLLFSYGSLRSAKVRLQTFGREPVSFEDRLLDYEVSQIGIANPLRAEAHGATHYATVTPRKNGMVNGIVLELTQAELALADTYELLDDFVRHRALTAGGRQVWVYRWRGPTAVARPTPTV